MLLSQYMICEGSGSDSQVKEFLKTTPGLKLFPNCIIDTHFLKRGRLARLAHAITRYPNLIGIGLEENNAIFYDSVNGYAECFGKGTITLMEKKIDNKKVLKLSSKVLSLTVHFLTAKDYFTLG